MRYSQEASHSFTVIDGNDPRDTSNVPRGPDRLLTIETINNEFPIKTYDQWKSEQRTIFKTTDSERTLQTQDAEISGIIESSTPAAAYPFNSDQCTICLEFLDGNDIVRPLKCFHCFHQDCIDPWLTGRRGECPLCKRDYYQPPTTEERISQSASGETTVETIHVHQIPAASQGGRVVGSRDIMGRARILPIYSFMQERNLQEGRFQDSSI